LRKSSRASDLIRPFWRMSSNRPQVRNCIASSDRGAAHTCVPVARDQAHACKLACDGRSPMIGMLLHPSSPLTTLCGPQPQAAACPFPTWTSPAARIAGFSSTATPQPPGRARWSRRCDAGATARVLTHDCASSWPSARSPPAGEQTLNRPYGLSDGRRRGGSPLRQNMPVRAW
jgi:hypothetical protein